MRLVSYARSGRASFGAVRDDRVIDLKSALGDRFSDLRALLAADALELAKQALDATTDAGFPVTEAEFLPVIPNPSKIVCVGLNYREHVAEVGRTVIEHPTLFLRVAESQVGHDRPIPHPPETVQLDYEGEIAVVIGRPGRRIAESMAWCHIAGFACYNDVTVRDWQKHSSQWTPGKNFFRTGAFGPWMVTADEVGPDAIMTLVTRVNGREVQRATSDMMIHSIAQLIAYVSVIMPFVPGDVLVTGTPGGVGARRNPPLFLIPGDTVEVEVDRLGTLRNSIMREP